MVFISHDLLVVKSISDRVMVMYLGKVCEIGAADEVYSRPAHPYTRMLLDAIPDPQRPRAPATPDNGETPSPMNMPGGCRFNTRCVQATALCAREEPVLQACGNDHFVACHHPQSDWISGSGE